MSTLTPVHNDEDQKWLITTGGLEIVGDMTFDECHHMIDTLATTDTVLKFALGDAIIYARQKFGESYAPLLDELRLSRGYIYNITWVASRVPKDNRGYALSFSHFYEVSSVKDPEEQREWLELCLKKRWSREDLRIAMKGIQLEIGPQEFVMPVNDRSAIHTVIAWLDGRYPLSKDELKELLKRYLDEDSKTKTEKVDY